MAGLLMSAKCQKRTQAVSFDHLDPHQNRSEVSICVRKRDTGSDRLGVVRLRIRMR